MTINLSYLSDEELDANCREADRQHCEYLRERKRRQEERARAIEAQASEGEFTYESVSTINGTKTFITNGSLYLELNGLIPALVSVGGKQVWPVENVK